MNPFYSYKANNLSLALFSSNSLSSPQTISSALMASISAYWLAPKSESPISASLLGSGSSLDTSI